MAAQLKLMGKSTLAPFKGRDITGVAGGSTLYTHAADHPPRLPAPSTAMTLQKYTIFAVFRAAASIPVSVYLRF